MPENLPTPPPLPPEMLAKGPPTPPPDLPDPSELFAQLKQLEGLLSLEESKLVKLRQTIEYIEKLSPAEREAMRLRLVQITRSTPELRTEISRLNQYLPATLHNSCSQFWLAASEQERADLRANLEGLSDARLSALLEQKVRAFIKQRDAIISEMKDSLESRAGSNSSASPGQP